MVLIPIRLPVRRLLTCWHYINHKFRIRDVSASRAALALFHAVIWVDTSHGIGKEHTTDHAWDDDQKEGKDFQKGSQDTASLGMSDGLGCESSLDYNLMRNGTMSNVT